LTVAIIERDFVKLALYCPPCLIHSYRWTPGDTALSLTPVWEWAAGYALMAAIFLSDLRVYIRG